MNYLGMNELIEKFSVSRKTITVWRRKKDFPKPVQIAGTERKLWIEEEVEEWAKEKTQRVA